MKKFGLLIILLSLTGFAFPTYVGTLPELMKPGSITVSGNELYVMEEAVIFVYSFKDKEVKLLRKFGKKGEGPGEQAAPPFYMNKISVLGDVVMSESFNKIIFFTKDGKVIKEIKKKLVTIFQSLPAGKNFAVNKGRPDPGKGVMYNCISLFDGEMNEIKELYSQDHFQQGQVPSIKLDMLLEYPVFKVFADKIFVEESPRGFIIQVYDSMGNKLYRVEKEYEKIKVTDSYKNEVMKKFKEDPFIKLQGGYEQVKNIMVSLFPDTFPAIQSFEVSADKIYVQTYKRKDNKEEYVIMDLKGKILKRVYLPRFENVTLMGKVLGAKLHTIYNDKLYYLLENEDEEEWELHVEEVK